MAIIGGMSFFSRTNPPAGRRARRARLLALAASLLALTAAAAATAPTAAHAAALTPAASAARAQAAAPARGLLLSHVCRVLGSDGTTQAVHCADLVTLGHGSAAGQNEVYCQNIASHVVVACPGIVQSVELAVSEGRAKPVFTRPERGICGPAFQDAACPAGRDISRTAPTPAGPANCPVWTVSGDGSTTNGGGGFPDAVILPSGRGVTALPIKTPRRRVSSCPPR